MASRFPVTFFKRKIQTKLPGELPGVPSRFPVTFWLSKFWTRLSSKFHFRALTGKMAASGNGNIMLYIYRFLPICRYVLRKSANNALKSMILWRFTTKRYHNFIDSGTITPSQHVSHWLCQWARPPKMAQVRKASISRQASQVAIWEAIKKQ